MDNNLSCSSEVYTSLNIVINKTNKKRLSEIVTPKYLAEGTDARTVPCHDEVYIWP